MKIEGDILQSFTFHRRTTVSLSFPPHRTMLSYVEQSGEQPILQSLLIDSDRESNKSDDLDTVKQQSMYIWNKKYEVSWLAGGRIGYSILACVDGAS